LKQCSSYFTGLRFQSNSGLDQISKEEPLQFPSCCSVNILKASAGSSQRRCQ